MKKKLYVAFAVLALVSSTVFLTGGGCDAAEVCGPCGTVVNGDVTISGDAALDGFFSAVASLDDAFVRINGEFEIHVRALADAYGVAQADVALPDLVTAVSAAIKLDLDTNLQGSLKADMEPAKCQASLDASFSAQAKCEAKAGCDVDIDAEAKCTGGKLEFECKGTCEGSCSGTCSVPSCEIELKPGKANCSGTCKGSCTAELTAAAECSGTCQGKCDGDCAAYASSQGGAAAECNGKCSGNCQGTCTFEAKADAKCEGECSGSCEVESPSADVTCKGELGCKGTCDAKCSGGCQGEATPPKCTIEGKAEAKCDASAKCEGQASAQASAKLECTPPKLSFSFGYSAALDSNLAARAAFDARMDALRVHMIGILQGFANMKALFDHDAAVALELPEAPFIQINTELKGLVSAATSGDFDIPAGLLPCVVPAFEDAIKVMASVGGKMTGSISMQAEMVGSIGL